MSTISTPRPRNAAFQKDRARIQYAARRLTELRQQGVSDDKAWDTIRAELKGGAK